MKEIDFLPQWYKHTKAEQKKHREFYIAMALILAVMTAWSIFANSRVASVKAQNTALQNAKMMQNTTENEYTKAQNILKDLQGKKLLIEQIKSNITVSNVIAEISNLLDGRVVLKKLDIVAEPIPQEGKAEQSPKKESDKKRFKIVVSGFAADAASVAETINKLESSAYFFQVIPAFSRQGLAGKYPATEFELICYLENYAVK